MSAAARLIRNVCEQWGSVPDSSGDAVAIMAVEANVCKLCQLQNAPAGLTSLAEMGLNEWRTLLEVAERGFYVPGSKLPEHILSVVHSIVIAEVQPPRCGAASDSSHGAEAGLVAELLCDYLDLILVPSTLRRPSLREDAVRCPCERCLAAAQALQRMQHSTTLRVLLEASVLPLLCAALEHLQVSDHHIAQGVAESLAVFATCARLQESSRFYLPHRTVHAMLALLQTAFPLADANSSKSNSSGDCTSPIAWSSGVLCMRVLHILRNVASNHTEVLEASADGMASCGRAMWAAMEASCHERRSNPAPRKRHGTGDKATTGVTAKREEGMTTDSALPSTLPLGGDSQMVSPPLRTGSSASSSSSRPSPAVFDTGNPQESDEGTSGAEFGALSEPQMPKQTPVQTEELAELEGSRQRSRSPENNRSLSIVGAPDLQQRCAEQLALFSLALQAVYQTDEALRQPGVLASEEAVRWQLVTFVQPFRTGSPLTPKWRERLVFQGLRLYLLLSRASHKRRQYVVLQRHFVEEEQRMVAFLLSLTPASQQCCVLLRAMAQDVHSWLVWQAQAPPTVSSSRAVGPPQPPRSSLPTRPRRRRTEKIEAVSTEATGKHKSTEASSLPSNAGKADLTASSEGTPAVDIGEMSVGEDPPSLTRIFSPEGGEAVWLVHGLLLLAVVLFLLFVWHSLEHPRGGVSSKRSWKYEM